jgi:hypothetical protein
MPPPTNSKGDFTKSVSRMKFTEEVSGSESSDEKTNRRRQSTVRKGRREQGLRMVDHEERDVKFNGADSSDEELVRGNTSEIQEPDNS